MSVEKPWSTRMAAELFCLANQGSVEVGLFEAALEAAGEVKAVRLKVLLAQCYQILKDLMTSTGSGLGVEEGFMDEVKDAFKS